MRFVQLTPPGSACSIAIGTGLVDSAPGSLKGLQVVVDDADAATGVPPSNVASTPARCRSSRGAASPDFRDPDGNEWAVQQLPDRP